MQDANYLGVFMKVEILLRETPFYIENFFRAQNIDPVIPEEPFTEVKIWSQDGEDGVLVMKDEFDGEPCYRVLQNADGLTKFLRALWNWDQNY